MKILLKIILTALLTFVMVTPTLFIAGGYGLIHPIGFLQSFFVIGAGIWLLGGIQLTLFIVWIFLILWIW